MTEQQHPDEQQRKRRQWRVRLDDIKVKWPVSGRLALVGFILALFLIVLISRDFPQKSHVEVPDLAGTSRVAAETQLKNRELNPRAVYERSDQPAGTVLRSDPTPGEKLDPGDFVSLIIAGPPPDPPILLPPPPSIPPPPLNPEIDQLAAFLADCENGLSRWQVGQVDYPGHLSLGKGESGAYVVAVDIRNSPLPAEKVIPGANPQSAPIAVQCVLGARLAPVGKSLEVDDKDWILREFTPTGVLNWSWSTTALAPGDHELRLELQPAVATRSSPAGIKTVIPQGDSSPNTSTFITRVRVDAS